METDEKKRCAQCNTDETVDWCRGCLRFLCDECAWESEAHQQHMED